MDTQALWVPFSTLNARTHSAATRLSWILLHCCGKRVGSLSTGVQCLRRISGLAPATISTACSILAKDPLEPCKARPHGSCAEVPVDLLTDTNLSAGARLLYGQLQGVPDFAADTGSFTFAALSALTGNSHEALRRAAVELSDAGWLAFTQKNRKSPLHFTLRNPVETQVRARVSSLRRRVRGAQYRGEALLREFLNLLVDLSEYEDNASPDLLLNPFTGELMELDRYYRAAGVAFELNGAQHYEETGFSTFEETVKQVGRDAMKAYICRARGIELVVLRPEDLSLRSIDQKIPGRLPRRDLEGLSPLVAELEAMATEYRNRTAEEQAREKKGRRGTLPRI